AEYFGWRYNFMFLSAFAIVVIGLVLARLPETLVHHSSQGISFYAIAMKLMKDRHVIGYGLIVAGCNGILFSYFAEGPFYFINLLGMGSAFYGATFMAIALSTMVGGLVSRMLLNKVSSQNVMRYGIYCVVLFSGTFTVAILVHYYVCAIPPIAIVMFTIVSQMGCAFGICMATSNALSLALVNYKMAIGVASSLFGFFYYIIIAVLTMMMGCLHNGTLLPMPLYFFGIGLGMLMVSAFFLRSKGG
ncbi:MAG: Bcr/CflA family drug resistance efflux transporter, partial [Alphaproteobacteria bacterium]|nr:Bcr/CflA family drug resistance efflux transporter [Alphaproteobacteria bacterium]